MRKRVVLSESSAAHKSFHFRPPDPVWAPTGLLETVRRRLREFDSGVGLWWSATRRMDGPDVSGRWRVVQWCPGIGNWTTSFYWEGDEGQYREPCAEAIVNRLRKARRPLDEAAEEVDEHNRRVDKQRQNELVRANYEYAMDKDERNFGVRQTFAPGYIRRRFVKPEDLQDTNHTRFLREHEKKWGGSS